MEVFAGIFVVFAAIWFLSQRNKPQPPSFTITTGMSSDEFVKMCLSSKPRK